MLEEPENIAVEFAVSNVTVEPVTEPLFPSIVTIPETGAFCQVGKLPLPELVRSCPDDPNPEIC